MHKRFNSIEELAITKGLPTEEMKAEIETHQVISETKARKYLA